MLTIDEIKIEGDEDGFYLVIHTDPEPEKYVGWTHRPDPMHRYRIGLPDQFRAEVERTIGAWLAEGERAARQHQIDQGGAPDSRRVELDEEWSLEPRNAAYDPDLARDMERGK